MKKAIRQYIESFNNSYVTGWSGKHIKFMTTLATIDKIHEDLRNVGVYRPVMEDGKGGYLFNASLAGKKDQQKMIDFFMSK